VDGNKRLWNTVPRRYSKLQRRTAQWMVVGEATTD
jgi:hypothetical protein